MKIDFIYIKARRGKYNEFIELLNDNNISFDYIGDRTVMIHRQYFIFIGKVLNRDLVEVITSTVKGL